VVIDLKCQWREMERPRLGENLKDGYKLKVARENRQN